MDPKNLSWQTVILLLGISILAIGAIIVLSVMNKDSQAVFTIVMLILAAAGFVTYGTMQQVKDQTNGRMSAMQDQQAELITMVRDLALMATPPTSGTDDHTHEIPKITQTD